jgi:hypothetical protein
MQSHIPKKKVPKTKKKKKRRGKGGEKIHSKNFARWFEEWPTRSCPFS